MRQIAICGALVAIFFVPNVIFAQGGIVPCNGPECNACHFVQLGQNILEFLIIISVIIGGIMFAVAGFYMLTSAGDTGKVAKGRTIFTNVVIGLVILLAAWLIIDTVMKVFLPNGETQLGPWNQIECAFEAPIAQQPSTQQPGTVTPVPGAGQLNHDDALAQLQSAGVFVTSTTGTGGVQASCPTGSGCTSLQGVREQTVQQVVNIRQACNCDVTLVGAAEGGHASGDFSHGNGYKVDLDDSAAIDSYLQNSLTRSGSRSGNHGGARYLDGCGNEYVRENTHWDITVSNGSCAL